MIRQNCRPQGVKYLSRTNIASTQMALIVQALPTQYTESGNALDQSMDGLNNFGPKVDVSSQTEILRAKVPEGCR
ncbi:Uncharacterised protein [Mycobacterium tuberculosis]|uniref:Uncharacterized protein n=1 Tax=Mycobacterium tuberculosis TaxID=1773 RepID=A0A0T5XXF0_MYCTX|nr:Uncharacterized protein BCGR_1993 [Mycobacterium tuberculosis variant bovis BCG]AOZ43005.1 hypothetical protein BTB1458_2006 [Mycobacterium tuberculosis]BAQ05844.1 hypothetical protein KURONO_2048 [Mycobacterium tuberculosis str. Kurono]GAA45528.1 hypothetical protein NCGM2209_2155 [Mycobacterium tuberculosis NCGM2209]KRT42947.1 hypothetical protein EI32_0561 [Mycobacterium tuberculosis]